jgi:ribonuclease HII
MLLPFATEGRIECGVDEAGRGALAGPVVAAAVIWDPNVNHEGIRDSKKLTPRKREEMEKFIKANALYCSVCFVDNKDIDAYNILNATYKAMHGALELVNDSVPFDHILVDGNRFKPFKAIPHTCVIKGDDKYMSIAAASILAKTARDRYMQTIECEYPVYQWKKNLGYGTRAHMQAIQTYGPCKYHRMTFKLDTLW